jgi:hypothetical protein
LGYIQYCSIPIHVQATPGSHHVVVQEMLEEAQRRKSSPKLSYSSIPLTVVSHDDFNVSDLAALPLQGTSRWPSYSLIRIAAEDTDLVEQIEVTFDLLAGIILNNLGVITLCKAKNGKRAIQTIKREHGDGTTAVRNEARKVASLQKVG